MLINSADKNCKLNEHEEVQYLILKGNLRLAFDAYLKASLERSMPDFAYFCILHTQTFILDLQHGGIQSIPLREKYRYSSAKFVFTYTYGLLYLICLQFFHLFGVLVDIKWLAGCLFAGTIPCLELFAPAGFMSSYYILFSMLLQLSLSLLVLKQPCDKCNDYFVCKSILLMIVCYVASYFLDTLLLQNSIYSSVFVSSFPAVYFGLPGGYNEILYFIFFFFLPVYGIFWVGINGENTQMQGKRFMFHLQLLFTSLFRGIDHESP